jgi:DNA-binding PadR family transcriptional regulator
MNRIDGPDEGATPLASERRRVLEALDGEVLTGPAILRRMRERPIGAEAGAEVGAADRVAPGDESLLYPAMHSLEADWKLKAMWLPDGDGGRHRTYRKRRLLPRGPG